MLPFKTVLGFFVRLVLLYTVLVIPWPGVGAAYGGLYRIGGELLFGTFSLAAEVHFQRLDPPQENWDTELVLRNRRSGAVGKMKSSSRNMGYIPTAVVVALILATPIGWKRRGRALLWALVLVNIYVALRVWLSIFDSLSGQGPGGLYALSPFWKQVLDEFRIVIAIVPANWFVVPVFIWVLVCFRRQDWAGFVQKDEPASKKPAPASRPGL